MDKIDEMNKIDKKRKEMRTEKKRQEKRQERQIDEWIVRLLDA